MVIAQEEMLTENNISSLLITNLQVNKKHITRISQKSNQKASQLLEEEDALLIKEKKTFETFLINYSSQFVKKFY